MTTTKRTTKIDTERYRDLLALAYRTLKAHARPAGTVERIEVAAALRAIEEAL